ncbi:hypothetical protein QOT17_018540 [Balamuthia mandrillaris]
MNASETEQSSFEEEWDRVLCSGCAFTEREEGVSKSKRVELNGGQWSKVGVHPSEKKEARHRGSQMLSRWPKGSRRGTDQTQTKPLLEVQTREIERGKPETKESAKKGSKESGPTPRKRVDAKAHLLLRQLEARSRSIPLCNARNGTKVWELDLQAKTLTSWNGAYVACKVKARVRSGHLCFEGFLRDGRVIWGRLSPVAEGRLLAKGALYTTRFMLGLGTAELAEVFVERVGRRPVVATKKTPDI